MSYHNPAMNSVGPSALLAKAPDSGQPNAPANPFRIRTYVTIDSKRLKLLYIPQLQKIGPRVPNSLT
jgi:hypothetical protein